MHDILTTFSPVNIRYLSFPPALDYHDVGRIAAWDDSLQFRNGNILQQFATFRLANAVVPGNHIHHHHLKKRSKEF